MRCAIYTRKSVDEGMDAAFTTLENQRDYCAKYIASQAGEGWIELPARYDDGGWSGGNLKRPALTQLRTDIEAGLVDIIVVYKIDRLSRSLRDFANLVAEFETRKVTFVSVTQSFDTGTAMGRLTLNVLLTFAQFERELTSERLRDWFAGASRKGLWTRQRPFGYAKGDGNTLIPHPSEAKIVQRIFRRYCKLGSCRLVADELFAEGITNTFGRPFSAPMVLHTIKHRIYRGEMIYRSKFMPGTHEPIVSEALWRRAQKTYLDSKWHRRALVEQPVPVLLKGIIFDRAGMRMHHTFMHAKGRLYRYYVAGAERRRYGASSDAYMRFRADDLEECVMAIVDRMTGTQWTGYRATQFKTEIIRRTVERIEIDDREMRVIFRSGAVVIETPKGRLAPRQQKNHPRMIKAKGAHEPGN